MPRGARETLLPLRKLLLEQRPDAAAEEVARQRFVSVALVLDPVEPVPACVVFDLAARRAEERAPERLVAEARARRHAARAARAGAAQQVHQHRLGLVVEVVRERDAIRLRFAERLVACFARGGFEAFAFSNDPNFFDGQRHCKALAELAAEGGP